MKKVSRWFLTFLLILLGISTCNVYAEEWETFVKRHAEEIVKERFNADYGAADFWEELVDANGPFRFWTVEQKNWYSGLLPYLIEAEEQRIQTYHPDWIASVPFADQILSWKYGVREPGMIEEDEARQMALDFLMSSYDLDCSENRVSVSLYTGHRETGDFIAPYWVFRFYDHSLVKAEVWINAKTGYMPRHQMLEVKDKVKESFVEMLKTGYTVAGEPVTADMFTDDAVEIYFSEEDHLWYAAVNPAGDSYWYISIDDATLETVSTSTANG